MFFQKNYTYSSKTNQTEYSAENIISRTVHGWRKDVYAYVKKKNNTVQDS